VIDKKKDLAREGRAFFRRFPPTPFPGYQASVRYGATPASAIFVEERLFVEYYGANFPAASNAPSRRYNWRRLTEPN
jgi:hypothetical protein